VRTAVIFDNFGPYHLARLRAVAGVCDLTAIEVASGSAEYKWERRAEGEGQRAKGGKEFQLSTFPISNFKIFTLFRRRTSREIPRRELVRKMNEALDACRPEAVFIPGWSSRAALTALSWCVQHKVPVVTMSESTEWDEQRSAWREAVKQRIVGLFSSALAGGRPHKDYLMKLGMPAERILPGYDAVDNRYFEDKAVEVRRAKCEGRRTESGKQKAESRNQGAEVWGEKAEMLKEESEEQRAGSKAMEVRSAKCEGQRTEVSGQESDDKATGLRTARLPYSPFFLASARFIEKKNLPRLLQAYARYRELAARSKEQGAESGGQGAKGAMGIAESRKQKTEIEKAEGERENTEMQKTEREGQRAEGEGRSADGEAWSLVLLGDGKLRPALAALRSALGLDACVLLPGFKQYDELPVYYGLAGAFIHASTTEQWGLVVNEAMASGLPVLVSNRCGCAQDLVQEGVNGFTFDPNNVEQLAQLMLRAWSMEPRARIEMGAASQRIISDWGTERFAQGLKSAAECALQNGPAKPTLVQRVILRAMMAR